ncbi:MAG TPA: gluconokinase [Jatrophihabitantaceae bacterium]|nr:gluconokinase [Jatrophihabitantaceae bacterium]
MPTCDLDPDPPVIVVTGVAGSGKTTVGSLLARRLGWRYAEADDFHPKANLDKMAAGDPLTDEDRWPWLHALAGWIDERRCAGEPAVVSCSGLKRKYRDLLRAGRPQVRLVFLSGSRELIGQRLRTRHGHFMKEAMLASQFADLEPPAEDEDVLTLTVDVPPDTLVDEIVRALCR